MKKFIFLMLILLTGLSASVGKLTAVKGEVYIDRASKQIKATSGSLLELKDKVITKDQAKALILMNDKTSITVGKNSTIIISEYVFDENVASNNKAEFNFAKGVFRTITGKIGKLNKSKFKIKAKSASIGIRGTMFDVAVRKEFVKVGVLEGAITYENTLTGEQYEVPTGKKLLYDPDNGKTQLVDGPIEETKEVNKDSQELKEEEQKQTTAKQEAKKPAQKKEKEKENKSTNNKDNENKKTTTKNGKSTANSDDGDTAQENKDQAGEPTESEATAGDGVTTDQGDETGTTDGETVEQGDNADTPADENPEQTPLDTQGDTEQNLEVTGDQPALDGETPTNDTGDVVIGDTPDTPTGEVLGETGDMLGGDTLGTELNTDLGEDFETAIADDVPDVENPVGDADVEVGGTTDVLDGALPDNVDAALEGAQQATQDQINEETADDQENIVKEVLEEEGLTVNEDGDIVVDEGATDNPDTQEPSTGDETTTDPEIPTDGEDITNPDEEVIEDVVEDEVVEEIVEEVEETVDTTPSSSGSSGSSTITIDTIESNSPMANLDTMIAAITTKIMNTNYESDSYLSFGYVGIDTDSDGVADTPTENYFLYGAKTPSDVIKSYLDNGASSVSYAGASGSISGYINGIPNTDGYINLTVDYSDASFTGDMGICTETDQWYLSIDNGTVTPDGIASSDFTPYSSGTTPSSLSGDLHGVFYGPLGERIGGAFELNSGSQKATGVFGASKQVGP